MEKVLFDCKAAARIRSNR